MALFDGFCFGAKGVFGFQQRGATLLPRRLSLVRLINSARRSNRKWPPDVMRAGVADEEDTDGPCQDFSELLLSFHAPNPITKPEDAPLNCLNPQMKFRKKPCFLLCEISPNEENPNSSHSLRTVHSLHNRHISERNHLRIPSSKCAQGRVDITGPNHASFCSGYDGLGIGILRKSTTTDDQ